MEQILDVTIEQISNLGSGIAKVDGMVIFVENTCPKDKVRIQITKKTKTYAIGKLLEILEPSPHRVEPICPMQKVCGACQLQFIDYEYQLKLKNLYQFFQLLYFILKQFTFKTGKYEHLFPKFFNEFFYFKSFRIFFCFYF